jgi:hypothetical protein
MAARRLIAVVALGCALLVSAPASAASGRLELLKAMRVDDEVSGDVVAVGGDVILGRQARVHGHAVAVFGTVTAEPGATVDGRRISIRSLASLTFTPDLESEPALLPLSLRLLTSGVWLTVTTLLAFLAPRRLRSVIRLVPVLSLRLLVLGALAVTTMFAAMVAVCGLGPTLGVPLNAGLLLAFLAVKAVGLTVAGGFVGSWLATRLLHRLTPLTLDVLSGLALLLALRFLPLAGGLLWTVLSVGAFGVGVIALAEAAEGTAVVLPA